VPPSGSVLFILFLNFFGVIIPVFTKTKANRPRNATTAADRITAKIVCKLDDDFLFRVDSVVVKSNIVVIMVVWGFEVLDLEVVITWVEEIVVDKVIGLEFVVVEIVDVGIVVEVVVVVIK